MKSDSTRVLRVCVCMPHASLHACMLAWMDVIGVGFVDSREVSGTMYLLAVLLFSVALAAVDGDDANTRIRSLYT